MVRVYFKSGPSLLGLKFLVFLRNRENSEKFTFAITMVICHVKSFETYL